MMLLTRLQHNGTGLYIMWKHLQIEFTRHCHGQSEIKKKKEFDKINMLFIYAFAL